jgi:HSP20 family protein
MAKSLMPLGFGPSDPFLTLHREMNRLFDDVFRGSSASTLQNMSTQGRGGVATSMDVSETDKEFKVTVELPGVKEEDVDVTLQDDMLTIRGEKKSETEQGGEKENFHYVERSYGSFQRSLRLPVVVKPDEVKARFRDGVLTISLPKTGEQSRSHRIRIAGGGATQGGAGAGGGSGGNPQDKATTQSPKQ